MKYKVFHSVGMYDVVIINNPKDSHPVMGEDGRYSTMLSGYGVLNVETGVIESTGCSLPVQLFTAESSASSMREFRSLHKEKRQSADVVDLHAVDVPDDVVPN